jgi:hypothetical protein
MIPGRRHPALRQHGHARRAAALPGPSDVHALASTSGLGAPRAASDVPRSGSGGGLDEPRPRERIAWCCTQRRRTVHGIEPSGSTEGYGFRTVHDIEPSGSTEGYYGGPHGGSAHSDPPRGPARAVTAEHDSDTARGRGVAPRSTPMPPRAKSDVVALTEGLCHYASRRLPSRSPSLRRHGAGTLSGQAQPATADGVPRYQPGRVTAWGSPRREGSQPRRLARDDSSGFEAFQSNVLHSLTISHS